MSLIAGGVLGIVALVLGVVALGVLLVVIGTIVAFSRSSANSEQKRK